MSTSYAPIPVDIRSPSSTTLQNAIQSGLAARGYATEDDPVMAEYILVMLANAKTRQQIDAELSDLIGSDYSDEFTAWLWGEADRILNGGDGQQEAGPSSSSVPAEAPAPADASMDVVEGDARPSSPPAPQRSSRSPEQRRRSQSPPHRNRRDDDYGRGYGRDGGGFRDRQQRYDAPRRAPRELFDSAVSSAGRRQDYGQGRGNRGGEDGYRSRLAMDDEQFSGPAPHREFRIRGSAPINAASPPTGPRELFARSMNAAAAGSAGPAQPPRGPRRRDGGAAPSAGLSLLARAGIPDPRAAAFVPTGPSAMRLAAPTMTAGAANGSIFSRIDPMLPNNAPPPSTTDASATSTSSFPTAPTQTSLCRYSLGCTNPLCLYSHPSPSAAMRRKAAASIGRAMTASKDDPILTSDRPCRFGIECTNVECGFSHVSPAVLFVTLKNRTAGGVGGSGGAGGAAMVVDTTSTPCRFANECTNPSCGYAHFDDQGRPAPSPALTKLLRPGAASTTAASTGDQSVTQDDSELEINTEMADGEAPSAGTEAGGGVGADGKPLALDRALDNSATSSFNGAASGKKPCKFGSGCLRADCWFSHPEWRATPTLQQEQQESNGEAGGGGKLHISDRLSRFDREGDGEDGGEVERIIPVA